jgi:hypothetical protein
MFGIRLGSHAAVLAAALVALAVVPPAHPAAAQLPLPSASLELVAQPVSHGPEDAFGLKVRIGNSGTAPLEDLNLVVGVLNRVETRSALHTSYDLSAAQASNSFPVSTTPDEPLPPGESVIVEINDPVSSLVLLTSDAENGVYPLKLTLQDSVGMTLDTITTQLLFYTEPQETRLTVVPVLPIHDVPARGPDGVFHPDEAGYRLEEAVGERGWLTSLVEVLEEETAPPLAPARRGRRQPKPQQPLRLGLVPSPRMIEELADMADGYRRAEGDQIVSVGPDAPSARAAADILERLRRILETDGVQLIVAPYALPDLPALAGDQGSIGRQMSEAAVVLRSVLGQDVLGDVDPGWIFAPGGRIDASSLQELPYGGGAELKTFFSADSLEPTPDPDLAGCPIETLSLACPISVITGASGPLSGYALDPELQRHLVGMTDPEDGRVAMQRFFAETAMVREESPGVERVVVASISSAWHPARRDVETFLRNIAGAPWLTSTTPAAGLDVTEDRAPRDLPSTAPALVTQPAESYFETVTEAAEIVDHFISITPPAELVERLRRNILVSVGRSWWGDFEAEGLRYATATRHEVEAEFAKIGAVGVAETTLTSREGSIQFIVFNDTGYDVQIRVRLDARGDLVVTDADRELTITRDQQTVSYPVTVRASGIFRIAVRLETPDGFEIKEPETITVRSTEFNEIALGLTFGALAFLVLFYVVRGARRRRGHDEDRDVKTAPA